MKVSGRQYVAKVDDKAAAKAEFEAAVSKGLGAGLVSQDARDANKFTVSTFVGAGASVVFRLVYEELLERKEGSYQLVVKPAFNTIVNDYKIEVTIKESLPIKQLWTSVETDNIDPKQQKEDGTKCTKWLQTWNCVLSLLCQSKTRRWSKRGSPPKYPSHQMLLSRKTWATRK